MPHPLCTCTFRVLYACGREFVSSVYFLPITWNGISHGISWFWVKIQSTAKWTLFEWSIHADAYFLNGLFILITIVHIGLFMLITMVHVPAPYLIPRPRYLAYYIAQTLGLIPTSCIQCQNERYIVSWYRNEVRSWELHHCGKHENSFQMMS